MVARDQGAFSTARYIKANTEQRGARNLAAQVCGVPGGSFLAGGSGMAGSLGVVRHHRGVRGGLTRHRLGGGREVSHALCL